MNEIALANFYRVLNQADRFPTEKELADAAIAAKDELNSLRRASQESSPDANRQEPVATERLNLGNLRVIVECMTCTGKLPNGCPNCKGLDFCVKRHAQKTLDKLEAYRDKQK